ncbi:MAG TPA: aminomethyltransferase family protein [Pyrinomonadaceae bacterium]|nr:aminomethyltransferase family protein [Pyrinomonadaceae bacterium]
MTETTEQLTIQRSPLDAAHEGLGATMKEEGGWRLPLSYGDAGAEYRAVREGEGGLIDLSSRGRVEVSGSEAVQFLNGLITNDVKALAEGAWMRAAFPNVQGRLIAEARVLRLSSDRFLFDTEAVTRERILKTLERFTLAGDFRVRDLTMETALVSVQGAGAARVVKETLGEEAAHVERDRVASVSWNDRELQVIRATHTAEDGFDLFLGADDAVSVWEALRSAGARAVGFDALEILRIEAGLPRYGVDMDETNVVLEAAPDDAVSFTKGCYIGQEIIARIHWRGHVAKKLAGIMLDEEGESRRDDKVRAEDGKEVGRLTSVAFSPRLNRRVSLGYVKYDYLAPGTRVRVVSAEREHAGHVEELPFVRGSWHSADAETNA